MEKLEWREAFNRQPAYYIFIDLTSPITIYNVSTICQILQDLTALAISLKGSTRLSVIGIYALSARSKCIFPLRSIKLNYTKFQFSLECMQSSHTLFTGTETFEMEDICESLQQAIQQYETYFQGVVVNKEEWPQLEIVFFSAQSYQTFSKLVRESLKGVELAYIRKINIIMLKHRHFSISTNGSQQKPESPCSPSIFDNEDTNSIINSLLNVIETEANVYQLEDIMKSWLHDCGSDSDHLRLTVDKLVLRCDIRECLLSTESLAIAGQFCLFPDSAGPNHVGRANPISKQTCNPKVPVYTLEAVGVYRRRGLCESLLFGYPFVAMATRCWKMDWEELERNQQQFVAIVNYLYERDLVLLAKKTKSLSTTSEKVVPTGHFMFFPSKNTLLVKSVASKELLLPVSESEDKDISDDLKMEIKECMEKLEIKDTFNPLNVSSGLYNYLSSSVAKSKAKPSTSFVVPIINKDENKMAIAKKRKKCTVPPVTEPSTKSPVEPSLGNDFKTASSLLKKKFPQHFS